MSNKLIEKLEKRLSYKNDILGVHYIALNILIEFDKICRENNINYWLTDGTLLGAVRHKGFIPWDDDIDVCICDCDKERVINLLRKKLPYYLYLTNDSGYQNEKINFYKIRDRYSMELEKIEKNDRQTGIWIDIFPMVEVKENKFFKFISKKIPVEKNFLDKSLLKKNIRRYVWKILKFCGIKTKQELLNILFHYGSKKSSKNSYTYPIEWHTYRKEWIFPLKELEFEGYKFLVPNNPYKYLKSYYGKDYMKLPPKNKRTVHSIKIDLFNSNEHPESLKWEDREKHYKKWVEEKGNEK